MYAAVVAEPYDDTWAAVPYALRAREGRDDATEPTDERRSSSASIAKSTSGSLTGVVARVIMSRGRSWESSSGAIPGAVL